VKESVSNGGDGVSTLPADTRRVGSFSLSLLFCLFLLFPWIMDANSTSICLDWPSPCEIISSI